MSIIPTVTYSTTANEVLFPVPFPYLSPSDVKCYVNGVLVAPLTWVNATTVTPPGAPFVTGTQVVLNRETPEDALVNYAGGPLNSTQLNLAQNQSLFLIQEQMAEFTRTMRVAIGETLLPIPNILTRAGALAAYDTTGQPSVLSMADLVNYLIEHGFIGDGALWPSNGGVFTTNAPGTTIATGFTLPDEPWMFPVFRNGIEQQPTVDYQFDPDGVTLIIPGGFIAGETFWGYRAGGGAAVDVPLGIQKGVTTPEDNWIKSDGGVWTNAFQRALATGKRVMGSVGFVYSTDRIQLPQMTDLRDCHFKDLFPLTSTTTRKFLSYVGAGRCKLVGVTVDRNGDGSNGALDTSAAIWVQGGRAEVEDCEVFGGGMGAGIKVTGVTSGYALKNHVHDLIGGTTSGFEPANDVINGMDFEGTPAFSVRDNTVQNILTRWSSNPSGQPRHTRGIAIGGAGMTTRALSVQGNVVTMADQAFDITGDEVPRNINIIGNHAELCPLFGFKLSNTIGGGIIAHNIAWRIGFTAFEISPSSSSVGSSPTFSDITFNTHNLLFQGNKAIDVGYNLALSGQSTAYGFKIENSTLYPDYPPDIEFADNSADGYVDGASVKWMDFGFVNQQSTIGINAGFPKSRNNRVNNAKTAQFQGFEVGRSDFSSTTSTTATTTPSNLAWDTTNDNFLKLALTVSNTTVTINRQGRYVVVAHAEFSHDPTGDRIMEIVYNGAVSDRFRVNSPACSDSNDDHSMNVVEIMDLLVGDTLSVAISERASTGTVTVNGTFKIIDLGNPQGARQ